MLGIIIAYKYLILVPLAILEGPFLAFVCGAATSFGYLNPFIAFGILMFGDILPDLVYYYLGSYMSRTGLYKRSRRYAFIADNLQALRALWHEHGLVTMLSSKLAYGLTPPFIVSAGLLKLPFRRFIRYSVSVSSVLLGLLFAAGYFLAAYYSLMKDIFKNADIFVGFSAVVFLAIFYLVSRYFRSRLEQYRGQNDAAPSSQKS